MPVDRALIQDLRTRLAAAADPDRAPGMQAYMKSALPYYGVPSKGVTTICREVFKAHPLATYEDWRDTGLALFRDATHREEWYAALNLAERPSYRAYARQRRSLAPFETFILEGAWWDIVDTVASHLVGGLFAVEPEWTAARMLEWSTDSDSDASMWKRRASIISQLSRRDAADLDLLFACIEPNIADREFFIRKAIGWALRQAARLEPEAIAAYVAANQDRLSGLSKREALKHITPAGSDTPRSTSE